MAESRKAASAFAISPLDDGRRHDSVNPNLHCFQSQHALFPERGVAASLPL